MADEPGSGAMHTRLLGTEQGLGLLAEIAHFGVWEFDLLQDELHWDDRMFAIYGVDPKTFTGSYQDWVATLEDSTRATSEQAFRDLVEHNKHFDIELRIRRQSDGTRRVLRGLARAFRDESGKALRVFGINEDITDRVKASRRLAAEESKFRGLFQESPVGIAMNDFETGEFIEFNRAMYEPTGYTREEFANLSYWDLTPKSYMDLEAEALKDMDRTGRYGPFEKEYRRKDGTLYPVRLNGAKTQTAEGRTVIWSIVEDISALTDARLAVRAEKERFEGIFEKTASGVAVYEAVDDGLDFIFRAYNPASERMDKKSREQVIGKRLSECFPGVREMGLLDALRQVWLTGEGVEVPVVQYADQQLSAWRENTLFKLSSGELVAVYSDLTEIKRAQEEAERANKAQTEFLANVSHEIRTPLNAVIGLSDLLAETELDGKQRDFLEKVSGSSRMLLGIINDVLDYSKIDAGKLQIEPHKFNFTHVLNQLDALFSASAGEKGIELSFLLDAAKLPTLLGDELRLTQILSNLLSNAVKFTERGSVQLKVEQQDLKPHSVEIYFAVSDTGSGIDEDIQARLFSPFRQADASTTRTHGGTGLGLAISQHLVMAMGGEIEVESQLDVGSTFSFSLRFPIAPDERESLHTTTEAVDRPPELGGKTILVVEDNALNRLVIGEILASTGARLLMAHNGQEAIDLIEHESLDLILMDLQMPVLDGYSAARVIHEMHPALPIVALSAAAMAMDRRAALDAGMRGHIAKPIDRTELFSTLNRLLNAESAGDDSAEAGAYASNNKPLPEELVGFDLSYGRSTYNDEDFYRELLHMFHEQLASEFAPIHNMILPGAREDDWHRVHKLKGSSGTVGAIKIQHAAAILERARRETPEVADMALDRLKAALVEANQQLEQLFS